MHFIKHFFLSMVLIFSGFFLIACEGGEADYSFEEVLELQKPVNVEDLIQGTIDFITQETMYVDQTSTKITTIKADTNENLTYSLVGGRDIDLFTIDERTGEVSFISTPAYDPLASNIYEVIIGALTPSGELSTLHIAVTVVPDITKVIPIIDFSVTKIDAVSSADVITQIQARPAKESDYLRYALVGIDAHSFTVDSDGNIAFKQPLPDYGTTPNKVYTISVVITDGYLNVATTGMISITLVGNRDEIRPVITTDVASIAENGDSYQIDVDAAGTGVVNAYYLSGNDAELFDITLEGVLSFNQAKDYEVSVRSFNISLQVEDDKGNVSDTKNIDVTLTDIDEKFTFEKIDGFGPKEDDKFVGIVRATPHVELTDSPLIVKYSLVQGGELLVINDLGEISFKDVAIKGQVVTTQVKVESQLNGSETNSIIFSVDVGKFSPIVKPVSNEQVQTPIEITSAITIIEATVNTNGTATQLEYELFGLDSEQFRIDENGALFFSNDVVFAEDGNNIYKVSVKVIDDQDYFTLTDSIVIELLQDPTTIRPVINTKTYYSNENIQGNIVLEASAEGNGAIARFDIVDGTDMHLFTYTDGYLRFNAAPDFESPHASSYYIDVVAVNTGGYESDKTSIIINVENVDEKLIFTSLNNFNYTVGSDFSKMITVSPTSGLTINYKIIRDDNNLFNINENTGELTFSNVPTYNSSGGNTYSVEVNASSQYNGSMSKSPIITVEVLPVSRAITFAVSSVDQNIFDAYGEAHLDQSKDTTIQVTATSAVGGTSMSYSIEGDSNIFIIDPHSGEMVISAPAYIYSDVTEVNTYRATVVATADDGVGTVDRLPGVMHVNYIDGTPTFSSPTTYSIHENSKVIGTVSAVLPVVVGSSLEYFIDGGADANLFTINKTTGDLSFWNAPNFETPQDSGSDNVYDVTVRVKDVKTQNTLNTAVQTISIQIVDVVEMSYIFGYWVNPLFGDDYFSHVDINSVLNEKSRYEMVLYPNYTGQVTYALINSSSTNVFSLDGNILVVDTPDRPFLGDTDYSSVTVRVTDDNGKIIDIPVNIASR